ncbi:MAG TPA: hypothetical protein VF053_16200 [Streptosporangiales bacterium]
MARCPRCGTDAPDEDRFCRTCGGYLTAAAPGFDEGETQQLPPRDANATRPLGIPAIDDRDEPPAPEAPDGPQEHPDDTFDAARMPMQAYPVQPPAPDAWLDAPDQGWYAQGGDEQGPPPDQPYPSAPPFEQQPGGGPAFPPPYGQAPHEQGQYGQMPPYEPGPAPGQGPPPYGQPPYGDQGGGYEGAGYYPYDEGTPKRRNGGRTAILAVVGAIAMVALVFGGVLFIGSHRHRTADAGSTRSASASAPQRSSSPSASPKTSQSGETTPQQQAVAVNKLLDRAVSGKSMLASAYDDALACKISPADAATQFETAAKNRRAIVASAKKLDTSKLTDGARIKQLLITMYSTSARADDAFADWAHAGDDAGQSCLKGNAKRTKGNSLSIRAGKQKQSFIKVWNPVARTYGQPPRTKNRL